MRYPDRSWRALGTAPAVQRAAGIRQPFRQRTELLGDQKDSGYPESAFEGGSISKRLRRHRPMPLNPQCPQPAWLNLMQDQSI